MSTRSQSRRPSKRRAVEENRVRGKAVLRVDLNAYPDDMPESSWLPLETSDTAVSMPYQAVNAHSAAASQAPAPIDVDAIEDDVVILSSTVGDPQVSYPPRRSIPVTVVLDDGPDACEGPSGLSAEEVITILSLGNYGRYERKRSRRGVINCDAYENLESNNSAERELVSRVEPPNVPQMEPTFSCSICWGTLVDETSTTCGHIFCQECIKKAIKAQKKCPSCRKPLTLKKIHRVYLPTTAH